MLKIWKVLIFIRYSLEIWGKGKKNGFRVEGARIEMKRKLYGLVIRVKKVFLMEGNVVGKR